MVVTRRVVKVVSIDNQKMDAESVHCYIFLMRLLIVQDTLPKNVSPRFVKFNFEKIERNFSCGVYLTLQWYTQKGICPPSNFFSKARRNLLRPVYMTCIRPVQSITF